MIKKFNDFINEGMWAKGFERARTGELRREMGKKIKTELGFEMVASNPEYDYDELIRWILDGEDGIGIDLDNFGNYDSKKQTSIKKGTNEYAHMVNNRIVASFESYEDLIDDEKWFDESEVSREDYIAIIKGIVSVLKQVEIDRKKGNGYDYQCVLVLIDESTIYDYECELSRSTSDNYFEDFESCFEDNFPGIELEKWSYNNYATNLGMCIDYDNLLKYKEVRDWVQDYFKNLKEMYEDEEYEEE